MINRHLLSPLRLAGCAIAAALALATLAPAPARADAVADLVGTLDPGLRDVRIVGSWKAADRQGVYRLVLTRGFGEAPPARLFVQWIAVAADGAPHVERTIEIAELGAQKLQVGRLSAAAEQGGLTVFVEVANPAADAPATYEAIIENDGSYRFDAASN